MLRRFGWRTAAFYPPAVFYIDSDKLKSFAETNFDFEYVKFEYIDAQRRVDQLLAYYDSVKPKRSFVWVHFFEPHEPYVAHDGFAFGDGDVDRYDSEIAYTDAAVGRLVARGARAPPGHHRHRRRRSRRGVRGARGPVPRLVAVRRAAAHSVDRLDPRRGAARGGRPGRSSST